MDRRHFFKIASLAAAALAVPKLVKGAIKSPVIPRCRVTVLRKECFMDIQSLYLDDPETGPCDKMECGATFDISGNTCPAGMCPRAWENIRAAIDSRSSCNGIPASGTFISSCPDGTRPVIFKVEI